jgi:hypothetical protein
MYERVRINRDEKLLFWPVIYAALQYFCVCAQNTQRDGKLPERVCEMRE